MNEHANIPLAIEPERYELFESPGYKFHFHRRDFIPACPRTRDRLSGFHNILNCPALVGGVAP